MGPFRMVGVSVLSRNTRRAPLAAFSIVALIVGMNVFLGGAAPPGAWAGHCSYNAYVDKHDRANYFWGFGTVTCNSRDKIEVAVGLYKGGAPGESGAQRVGLASRVCDRTGSVCSVSTKSFYAGSGIKWCARIAGRSALDGWSLWNYHTSCRYS